MSTLYVDESKSKGYTMVAAVVVPGDAAALRQEIRKLIVSGRRIHFTKESPQHKRKILSRLTELGVQAHVFHCDSKNDAIGRENCLIRLVAHAAEHAHTRIVLERDESIDKTDRRILYREVNNRGLGNSLSYELEQAQQEPLLWIADAIAWSYTKGGDWKRRAGALIVSTTHLAA